MSISRAHRSPPLMPLHPEFISFAPGGAILRIIIPRQADQTSIRGRVFVTGGHDLDRYVLWDDASNRRKLIG